MTMEILTQYPKAITMILIGLILYFVKPLIPDFFSPEITGALEIVISGVVIYLIGYFTRISKTEAVELDRYKH